MRRRNWPMEWACRWENWERESKRKHLTTSCQFATLYGIPLYPESLLPFISVASQGRRQLEECQTQRAVPPFHSESHSHSKSHSHSQSHNILYEISGWAELGGRLFCWAAVRLVRHRGLHMLMMTSGPMRRRSGPVLSLWTDLGSILATATRGMRSMKPKSENWIRGPKGGEIKEVEAVNWSDGQTAAPAANEVIKLCSPGDPIIRTLGRGQMRKMDDGIGTS